MTSTFEVHGDWWLPQTPDHPVSGILSWSPEDAGELRLNGQLVPDSWGDETLPNGTVQRRRRTADIREALPVVHGRSGERCFTLVNCFRTAQRGTFTDRPTEDLCVNAVVEGAWFDDPELAVDQVSFQMRHLTEWVDITGVDADYPAWSGTPSDVYAVVTATRQAPIAIPVPWGGMRLTHHLRSDPEGISRFVLTQYWTLDISHPQPVPLQRFFDAASDFQDLISIATGKPAEFGEVLLRHSDAQVVSLSGESLGPKDLTYHGRWSVRREPRKPGNFERPLMPALMYFSFADLGAEGVARWMATAERYRTELGRCMATTYSPSMFLEDRILNLCAALDSIGRDLGREHYREKLKAAVDLAGAEFLDLVGRGRDEWVDGIVRLRNDIAHHRDAIRRDAIADDSLTGRQLYWLVILCLLRRGGATASVYEGITRHGAWEWLRGQSGSAWHSLPASQACPPPTTAEQLPVT